MKLKITFLLLVIVMVVLINFNDRVSYGANKWDVFESMLQETQGKVVQCEVTTSFNLTNDKERDIDVCLELQKQLEWTKGKGASINITKGKSNYTIEFQKQNINGYVESTFYNNYNTITIDIIQNCQKNQIENINDIIDSAINKVSNNRHMQLSNKQTFKFIKAKVPCTDIHELNNKVIQLLKKHNSVNINTIDLNNDCSTVAYTGSSEYMLDQGKKMDLNYAICKYSSGNYVVIGTPIIVTPY